MSIFGKGSNEPSPIEVQREKVTTLLQWLGGLDSGRDWTQRTIELMPTTDGIQFAVAEESPAGPGGESGILPPEVSEEALALQRSMYKPGAGTWVTATLSITSSGSGDAHFNYNDVPNDGQGGSLLSPADVAAHLQAFPREPDATPAWMK